MRRPPWAPAIVAAALCGCELAPDYAPPTIAVPNAYREAGWTEVTAAGSEPDRAWWTRFGDPELDRLEAAVLPANQDLKAALARYDEARALARATEAERFPEVGISAGGEEGRLSQAVTNPQRRARYSDVNARVDISYELDAWGRIRDRVRAAAAEVRADADDLAASTVSVQAELADDYFAARALDAQIGIADQASDSFARAASLVRRRLDAGLAADADLAAAETALEGARGRAVELRLRRARLEHAIALLDGVAPAAFALPARDLSGDPPSFRVALPATLLQRRPDVAAAERRVQAANYRIGVARAAFFPSFDLLAGAGGRASTPAPVLSAPAEVWALGASSVLQLLDGGRRRADLAKARLSLGSGPPNTGRPCCARWPRPRTPWPRSGICRRRRLARRGRSRPLGGPRRQPRGATAVALSRGSTSWTRTRRSWRPGSAWPRSRPGASRRP